MSDETVGTIAIIGGFILLMVGGFSFRWELAAVALGSMIFTIGLASLIVAEYALTDVADSVCAQTTCAGRTPMPAATVTP